MPRSKGSKNKPKTVTADFATQIAEKQSAQDQVSFCGKNVQFKINKVFFDSSHLCDFLKGGKSCMRVLKVLQKLVVFQGTVCAGAVGWQRSLHLKPVGVKFIETDWFQHIII